MTHDNRCIDRTTCEGMISSRDAAICKQARELDDLRRERDKLRAELDAMEWESRTIYVCTRCARTFEIFYDARSARRCRTEQCRNSSGTWTARFARSERRRVGKWEPVEQPTKEQP